MKSLCPFFNGECKGNQCVMWYNENCLIVNFLQNISIGFERAESTEEVIEEPYQPRFEIPKPSIPEEIKQTTAEELAVEYVTFLETEFPESELTPHGGNFQLFLNSKNITSHWNLPPDIQIKIQKAEILAREEIKKKIEIEHRLRIEKEKEELPSLISRCIDWAITYGFKKVTLADVDAFLLENELDILKETKRTLYSLTNLKLKAKK